MFTDHHLAVKDLSLASTSNWLQQIGPRHLEIAEDSNSACSGMALFLSVLGSSLPKAGSRTAQQQSAQPCGAIQHINSAASTSGRYSPSVYSNSWSYQVSGAAYAEACVHHPGHADVFMHGTSGTAVTSNLEPEKVGRSRQGIGFK